MNSSDHNLPPQEGSPHGLNDSLSSQSKQSKHKNKVSYDDINFEELAQLRRNFTEQLDDREKDRVIEFEFNSLLNKFASYDPEVITTKMKKKSSKNMEAVKEE